ncbi:type I-E CRISPR-associated protein Cse1/CasA [Corynebacterium sp. CNCTC7651]|nr:type I-E CRISPR-associated protein Cse1/CasA [Corynebacterium sp. CNCTC7651]UIZ92559.1 type I-E CRISPR-associated protein Cse1/CasA [Corynebacterium sp. CNCTC7651]
MTFNLVDHEWVACHVNGEKRIASLRELFDGSTHATAVMGDSPTQDYAVLRVLLAVFWRAHHAELAETLTSKRARDDFEWEEWFVDTRTALLATGRDEAVLSYLDTHYDRFDLLDSEQPFMQVGDLVACNGTTQSVSRIVPEAEHDYFTMRTGDGREALGLAEAARWLIHCQAYDYSGIKTGAVGDPRVKGGKGYPIGTGWSGMTGGTVIVGSTLLETLILNTTASSVLEDSLPVWERDQDTAAPRLVSPSGAAEFATWQARRIRLYEENGLVTKVLVSNGDGIPDAGLNAFGDPMTPYRYSPNKSKKGKPAFYPRPHDMRQTMWRSLDPLIAVDKDAQYDGAETAPKRPETLTNLAEIAAETGQDDVFDVALVSMEYGAQSSSVAVTMSASIGLPLVVLRGDALGAEMRRDVRNAAAAAAAARYSLGRFAGQLLQAAGGEYAFSQEPADRLFAELEPQFVAWLRGVTAENIEEKSVDWQRTVRQVVLETAHELIVGAGPRALIGRLEGAGQDGGDGRILNAGTAERQLRRRLDKDLPLSVQKDSVTQSEKGMNE